MNSKARDSALFAVVVCAALGLGSFLHWPSIDAGLRSDDFPQRAMLRGEFSAPRAPLDLFNFASGDPRDVFQLMDAGYLPWWSVPDLRLRMWRPLASALMVLDQRILDASPQLQHVHSLGWYALLIVVASRLFKRWLSLPAAAIATLAFAIEEAHTVPVGWLANRSTLTATALGLLALELHAGSREAPPSSRAARLGRQVLTALSAGLALLAGEYAFTALAFVFAYECLRREPILARVRSSLPVLLPTIAYLIAHTAVGSDIAGSGYYISPLREPLAFIGAAFVRVPALFADLSFGIPAEWWNGVGPLRNFFLSQDWFSFEVWRLFPAWPVWHTALGYFAFAVGALLLRLCLRRAPEVRRRPLQVLALGTLLSLLPAAGSLPGDRLIVAAAFGVSGLFGALLVHALPRRGALSIGATAAWLFVFGVAGPLAFNRTYDQAGGFADASEGQRVWARAAELPPDDIAAQTRVYLLGTADFLSAANLHWARLAEGMALPQSYRRLCPSISPFDLRRPSDRTLEIRVLNTDVRYSAQPSLYRSGSAPILQNQLFRLPGLSVLVLEARDGNPAVMQFDFDRSVDDPSLWFLKASLDGLVRIAPPKVGETIRIPRPVYRDLRVPLPPDAD